MAEITQADIDKVRQLAKEHENLAKQENEAADKMQEAIAAQDAMSRKGGAYI